MCMAAGGLVSLFGGFVSAIGQAQEGAKAKQIADENAARQRAAGRYQAKQIRKKVSYINSRAETQSAARGLALSGSALDVITNSTIEGEIDAANAIKTANQEARVSELEGEAAQMRAQNGAIGSIIGGFSSFLRMAA